ncbi:SDR family oxidoreductase [Flavobacteriaceae bacterium]|jgi:3-oxoacyl-[acyl-carrier protein] reductase|nr:SDR family oxidoreductase [Flavobacteriaceae bacterium]MDA7848666.1 SDR family oxidoreductase [Flavobacteriaceae bacterium]MDB0004223.1 SDR family oxidoreductase [Flavobacteriaceae bacterium]
MKKIIIIGGSKGIGKAITENLLSDHQVVNISRTSPDIQHANLSHFTCDVLTDDLPEIEAADGLIYCPGSINLKPFNRLSIDDFKTDFEINVIGAVKCIQAYTKALATSESASIVLFSTVATKLGMPFHASIATAKSAVEGLTKSVAADLAPKIRVNAIAPTITDTELAAKFLRNERMVESTIQRHPLKKYLEPTEVAAMATYLLSDVSKSISGQIFNLDCGIVSLKL